MRWVAILLLCGFASAQTKPPVLVELFTSEGCSSCPPADQLLIRLEKDQPVAGADVIVLGEHVDYWDGQGWNDRFSSRQFTARQQAYADRFHIDGPYTPQMVVNGRVQFVGNDVPMALKTIQAAAHVRGPEPRILLRESDNTLHVVIEDAGTKHLEVMYAIAEDGLATAVKGGEHGGRELHHAAVVRVLKQVGTTRDARFEADLPLRISSGWRRENLHAVVFLQEGEAGHVLSAAEVRLGAQTSQNSANRAGLKPLPY